MGAKLDAEVSKSTANGLKNGGKDADKAGKKAAEDYSGAFNKEILPKLGKAVSDIPLFDGKGNSPWDDAFERLRRDIDQLSKEKIGLSIDEDTAFKSLENFRNRAKTLEETAPESGGFFNARSVRQRLDDTLGTVEDAKRRGVDQANAYAGAFDQSLKATLDKSASGIRPLKVTADTTDADRDIAQLATDMESLRDKTIGVDISSAEAMAEIRRIEEKLRELDRKGVDIQVRADARQAADGLTEFRKNADGAASSVSEIDKAANLTLSRMGYLIALGGSLGSVFVPGALAAAGALGLLATSALAGGAAVGVAALGLSGISSAVQALDKYSQQTAKSQNSVNQANRRMTGSLDAVNQAERSLANTRRTVSQGQADAARAVRDAVSGVAQARHDEGVAAREAGQQVADAQRNVTRAEADAKEVRVALNDVIQQAKKDIEDLAVALDRNTVDQQKAVTAQLKALNELNALKENPRSSEVELRNAKDNYDEQTVRLEELASKRRDLDDDAAKAKKLGVEGDDKVVAARKRVADADQKVSDQRVALTRAEQSAAEKNLDAHQRVADAQQRLSTARQAQTRQQADGAYQIATAQNAVATAVRSQQQALEKTGIAGGAALDNLNTAMGQLTPTGQRFARFIFGLKDRFLELRGAASDPLLPGLQKAIELLLPLLPGVAKFIGKIAGELGAMAVAAAKGLGGPIWRRFFSYIDDTAVPALQMMSEVGGNLAQGLISLYLALTPFDGQVGRGLVGLSEDFAKWAENLNKSKGYREFLEYVRENGPKVVHFLGEIGTLAVHLVEAFLPLGHVMLGLIGGVAALVNALPIGALQAFVFVLGAAALGLATLGGVVRAQKLKRELIDIFGDSTRSAVQKFAIDTGRATAETGRFRTSLATIGGAASEARNKIGLLPATMVNAFGERNQRMVQKYAIDTGFATASSGKLEKTMGTVAGAAQRSALKIQTMGAAMGGIRGAAGSLVGFLGGPWAIAIGAATVAIAYFTAQSDKQKQRVEALQGGLKQLSDRYIELTKTGQQAAVAADDTFKAIVANDPDMQKTVVTLGKLGISVDTMMKSLTSGDPSQVIRALDKEMRNLSDQENTWGNMFQIFDNQKRSDRIDELGAMQEAFLKNARAMGLGAQAQAVLTEEDKRNSDIIAIKNAHQKEGYDVQQKIIGQYEAYSTRIEHLNGFLAAFATGEGDAAAKAQALNDIINDQSAAWTGANEAAEAYHGKLLDLSDSVRTNGKSLSVHTRAGLANRDALEAAAGAARELYVQDIASGKPMADATTAHRARIAALKEEAAKAGLSTKKTAELIVKYGEVPEDVVTALKTQNFDKVYEQLAMTKFMQDALAKNWSVEKARAAWGAQKFYAKGMQGPVFIPAKAEGGAVSGPGTGTSDDVLMWGSDGEHMITAAEVDAAGGHDAIYAWRKAILAGTVQLPRYAVGGAVKAQPVKWPMNVQMKGTHVPTVEEIEASLWEGSGPLGRTAGGRGWRWQEAVLKAAFPYVQFTSTTGGGHAKNSWHYKGRAVDLVPHSREIMKWIHDMYGANTLELIGPYDDLDVWHGKPHRYSAALQRQHENHLHWAYDEGGWMQPGAGRYVNMTAKPEPVLNHNQWAAVEQQNSIMADLVAQANTIGSGRAGDTYNFEFANTTLDESRLKSIQQRSDALHRVARGR